MAESVQPFDLEGIYASAFIVTLGHLIKLSLVPDMQEYVALYIHTVVSKFIQPIRQEMIPWLSLLLMVKSGKV